MEDIFTAFVLMFQPTQWHQLLSLRITVRGACFKMVPYKTFMLYNCAALGQQFHFPLEKKAVAVCSYEKSIMLIRRIKVELMDWSWSQSFFYSSYFLQTMQYFSTSRKTTKPSTELWTSSSCCSFICKRNNAAALCTIKAATFYKKPLVDDEQKAIRASLNSLSTSIYFGIQNKISNTMKKSPHLFN